MDFGHLTVLCHFLIYKPNYCWINQQKNYHIKLL